MDPNNSREFMVQGQVQGQQQGQQPITARYKFSPDEIRVLRECNREAFYYRCLPLGCTLGVGAYYAVRSGYLKPSARWGAGPKMFLGSILGYFIGKFSYQTACVEKLMKLPNSQLADTLRKQKGKLGFQEALSMEPGFVTASPSVIGGPGFPSNYEQADQSCFTDVGDTRPMSSFDTESSTFTGVDYGKYDTTQQMLNDDNLPQRRAQFSTSYDELRKMNRNDYESRPHGLNTNSPINKINENDTSRKPSNSYTSREPQAPAPPRAKNIYGDVWDDKPQ